MPFERQQSPGKSSETVAARPERAVSRALRTDNSLLDRQRALGNQAVQRLLLTGALQAKLRLGQPNDAYEQEADRVADTVMRMPEPEVRRQRTEEDEEEGIQTEPLADGITPLVQRQAEAPPEEEEEDEEPPEAAPGEVQALVQRQEAEPAKEEEEEEEEPQGVQRKAKGADIMHVRDAALVQRLRSPSGGSPLSGGVRSFFERRFGYDFSEVRIHDSYRDRADAASLGARAFTYGKHIWLGDSESASDSRLIAHELTHVVQQNAGIRRRPLDVSPVAPRIQRSWWDRVTEAVGGAISSIGELAGDAKAAVLGKLAQWAKRIPGFDLLTVILGKDPISDQPVERNATNLIRGVMGLLGPPGLTMFENLQRAGAIDRAFEWFDQEIARLNLTWEAIKGLFRTVWDSLSLSDVANLQNAVAKVAQIFGPTLARLVNFASAAGRRVLEFIFEGALSLAGGFGTRVLTVVRRAGAVFSTIINDPIKFIGNLVAAVRGGFERFSENILDHLRTALMQWLFGALSGAGLTLPERFDLGGIISIVLQILGLTYDRLRGKLVGLIGEKNVAYIESAFDFLRTIVTGGLAAAWEKILEFVENLQEMVIGGIRDWVAKSVVGAAIKKLVTMFNPAGAIIQAIMAIYNTVVFFIERAQQIVALADAVFDSISNIAAGNVGAAINHVERTMARALPVVISFLARLIGLGNVGDNIRDIIKKVQAPVERSIDRVATFIAQKARGLWSRSGAQATPDAVESTTQVVDDSPAAAVVKERTLDEVVARVRSNPLASLDGLQTLISEIYEKHKPQGLKSLSVRVSDESSMEVAVLASASEPLRRTIAWESLFQNAKPEDREKYKTQPRNETNAALSVEGSIIGQVVKSATGRHAEKNLIDSYWDTALQMARLKAEKGQHSTIAVAINRAPCPKCTQLLTETITKARGDGIIDKYVRFILAPTGVYEPTENLTAEQIEADQKKEQEIANKLKTPAYEVEHKSTYTDDVTTMHDLEKLVKAGWDLHQLVARSKPTTAGVILGEVAHTLAVKAGRIKAGSA